MLNKVILIGRLVSDVQLRETQNGISYTYFTLAVNRPNNNNQTDFIDCVAWRGTAEILDKYSSKGSLIAIEGRLEVYKTESNGNYETRVNVNVNTVTLLDSRKNNEANASKPGVSNPLENNMETQRQPEAKEEVQEQKVESTSANTEENDSFEIDLDSIKF